MTAPLELTLDQLGRLDELARGGTATVYLAPELRLPGLDDERFVYKKYNEVTKQSAGPSLGTGLSNFVRFRERLPEEQREAWDARIIWPVSVVLDDSGAADGVIMRLIPERYFQEFTKRAGGVNRKPREVETLFGDDVTSARKGLPGVDPPARIRLIRAIAAAYGMMHKQNVVVGDISGRNIIYDPDPARPSIMVVDVDSARIKGNRAVFGMQPHTPNWQPPEALLASAALQRASRSSPSPPVEMLDRLRSRWAIQTTATDVYKFALMTVRILSNGRGGAVSRDPARARGVLKARIGDTAADLLDASFSDDAKQRPTMRDWYDALQHRKPGSKTPSPRVAADETPAVEKTSTLLANGHQVGQWVWVEGQGWVRRSSRPRP
ncbi:hypothetical protein Aca07nite_08280 [Actinoplanes capillaceus]|uniref:Protein kinase domain-containing protein n=1 Tax=Actinoplanes campanulatus TaxID=113559 RepID=A0ABQ3WBJ6_9ACTN|nr:hypothetical protein [Actinoplanes capillaceus]GID43553.1 hypothetical protein Aca07nite_08280 [Actinoplanes capillaceus]